MKLLDLYCGAGGGAWGYHLAGFSHIDGIDLVKQPNYPFNFSQMNVLELEPENLIGYDLIHASPPCQAYSDSKHNLAWYFPDVMEKTRELLKASGVPYVIENIPEAPMEGNVVILCGTMFEKLRVIRHRAFETSFSLKQPEHISHKDHPLVYTSKKDRPHYGQLDPWKDYVTVVGGGNTTIECALDAMQIPFYMPKRSANEAIPPPYTEYIGKEFLRILRTNHIIISFEA